MEGYRRRMRTGVFAAVIAVLGVTALVLLGLALGGSSLETIREAALPLLVVALVTGAIAWLGWREEGTERRVAAGRESAARERIDTELRRDDGSAELEDRIAALETELSKTAGVRADLERRLVESEERRERELAEAEQRREQELAKAQERREQDLRDLQEKRERELAEAREHEREEIERRDEKLAQERQVRTRLETARDAEREWNRELRSQIVTMHRERGLLGDTHDVRALVLHIAVTLLEAEKGMLLSRVDSDGDGDLDLVCAEGFENDPRESALAQRFADQVIEHDKTLREDGHEVDDETGTAADREIDNLVAIPIYVQDDFSGVVVCANKEGGFHEYDDDVLLALGDHAGAVLENGRMRGDLRSAYVSTVRLLAEAIEAKDPFLRGHSDEVSEYVSAVADKMGIERSRREELVFGSLLHDVGKIGISERILLKPAKLTEEEFGVVKLHPRIGYRLIDRVDALRPIAPAILHHHERWDGDGYPDGLAGEEIPLEARIVCVADSFSAMTAERPYRKRMSLDQACAELERCAGTQFDPEVVRIFVDQVRCRPAPPERHPLEEAMRDPQIEEHREGNEPLLGYGPLAVTDNLTLLYTHRYFHEIAEQHAVKGETFAVVLAELVDVTQLNHLEGYAAGDEAIRATGRAVQRTAVRCGGTACRYSGRRFGLIVPGADEETAQRVAAELAADLETGPRVVIGAAAAQDGDRGYDAIARARLALSPAPVAPPA
jgi:diguanylate cyclase (GGDEF)-like protein